MRQFFWPEIKDQEGAKKVCHTAAAAAFLIAIITTVIIILSLRGVELFSKINELAFFDVGLFLIIGVFLYRCSRIAAVMALLLYAFEQYEMIRITKPQWSFTIVLFLLFFINGIRGAFAYHAIKRKEGEAERLQSAVGETEPGSASAPEAKVAKYPKLLFSLLIIFAVGASAVFFLPNLLPQIQKQISAFQSPSKKSKVPARVNKSSKTINLEDALPEVKGKNYHTFRLKNGSTVSGNVVREDDVYYTLKKGSGEEYVIKDDIKSME
jgi:hypothetical protein